MRIAEFDEMTNYYGVELVGKSNSSVCLKVNGGKIFELTHDFIKETFGEALTSKELHEIVRNWYLETKTKRK